ncbi:Uncharacterised protein [uncultured archaeon]|nr:Uncharacterised protein [uncultured archaeon]
MTSANSPSEENKKFLREGCLGMINDIQSKVTQMMDIFKQNSTFPFDFYNLSLREADTKISCIRELYKRLTDEELE